MSVRSISWLSRMLIVGVLLVLSTHPGLRAGLQSTSVTEDQDAGDLRTRYVSYKIRCDNSGSISGSGPIGGVVCATGDWFVDPSTGLGFDARGAREVEFWADEVGTGSAEWSLYSCLRPVGTRGSGAISGLQGPGLDDPTGVPTASVPGPSCVKINVDSAGNDLVVTGTDLQRLIFTAGSFEYLVPYLNDCTGDCDGSAGLRITW